MKTPDYWKTRYVTASDPDEIEAAMRVDHAFEPLVTERLLLRAFREEDLDAYAEICADPEVMRHLGDGRTLTRAQVWRQMALASLSCATTRHQRD